MKAPVLSQVLNGLGFAILLLTMVGVVGVWFGDFPERWRAITAGSSFISGVTFGTLLIAAARGITLLTAIAAARSSGVAQALDGDQKAHRARLETSLAEIARQARDNASLQRQLLRVYGHSPEV